MNHQNSRGRTGNFCNSSRNVSCQGFLGHGTDSLTLRLILDIFIAGHSNCDLRRHLDSVSPETPIRDVVDRYYVWESHADPAVRRISKPTPDLIYPTYAVGDTDSDNEVTRLAAVTGLKLDQHQLTDLLRRVISTAEHPAPDQEISDMAKLLQQLGRDALNGPPAVVNPPVPTTLEQMLRSFLDGQRQRQRQPPRQRPTRRNWTDVVCFSCRKSGHTVTRCPNLNEAFPFLQPGWWTEKTPGGFVMIPPQGTTDRRRLKTTAQGGSASRVSIHARPGTQEGEHYRLWECPHDVVGLHAHKGTMWMSNDGVPLKNVESPYGGGVSPLLAAAGVCTPAMFPVAPALLADGPPLGPWQVAVVRVDEIPAGDSSGQDSPCVTQNRHRPMDIYELPDILAHTVVEGGPVGPEVTEPLALLVLDHADPVGQHAAIQNATSTLEHLPAQPEQSLGGRRGDRISDGEPTARQVPDTTLDRQLMEEITHLAHLALRVSLDSGPMEGTSCLEPLEQSILQSSWIARPCNGVIKQKSEWKPVITPASTMDSRPMEG